MIPDIRKPGVYTESNTSNALRGLVSTPRRVLLLGQKLSPGTAPVNASIRVLGIEQAKTLFGAGSQLSWMARSALSNSTQYELWALPMADPDGERAVGSLAFVATSLKKGTLSLRIAGQKVDIAIAEGLTGAQVATAVTAALSAAKVPELPVNPAVDGVDTAKVNLAARNEGVIGNELVITLLSAPTGLATTVVQPTGGEGTPDVTAALAAAFPAPFDLIVSGTLDSDQVEELKTHLDSLSGPLEQRMGVGVLGFTGTVEDAVTLAEVNSDRLTLALLRGSESPFWEVASAYAACIAGNSDPAEPFNGDQVLALNVPALESWLSRTEQETLLFAGVTPLEVTPAGHIQIVRAITTYTVTPSGTPDPTLLDLTTIRTLDELRKQWKARISRVFGSGAPGSNRKVTAANLEKIRAETLTVLRAMEALEQLRNIDAFADQVVVSESESVVGRVEVEIPAPVVPGLHIIAATFNLSL